MTSPVVDFRGTVLFWVGPIAVLMPSDIPLMFPVIAAVWMVSLSSVQKSLAQRLAVCLTLLLGARRIYRFFSLGNRLYSIRAARFTSTMGVISADLALNQSCDFEVFFQRWLRQCGAWYPARWSTSQWRSLLAVRFLVHSQTSQQTALQGQAGSSC